VKDIDPVNVAVWTFAVAGSLFVWYVVIAFVMGAL
jgi:hypothetical protein